MIVFKMHKNIQKLSKI